MFLFTFFLGEREREPTIWACCSMIALTVQPWWLCWFRLRLHSVSMIGYTNMPRRSLGGSMLVTRPAHRVIKGVAIRFTTILAVCCADYAAIRHRHKNNNINLNSLYFFPRQLLSLRCFSPILVLYIGISLNWPKG